MTRCEIASPECTPSMPSQTDQHDHARNAVAGTHEVDVTFGQRNLLWEGREAERWAEDAAGFGRWSIDLTNESVVWSRGLANLLGRAELAEQAIDLNQHIACYHPDDRTPALAAIKKGGSGAATAVGEFHRRSRIVRPDGEVRDVVLHGRTFARQCRVPFAGCLTSHAESQADVPLGAAFWVEHTGSMRL